MLILLRPRWEVLIKMQEGCIDYSLLQQGNGCCLNCANAYDGCLCFECKCSKCLWYLSPEENDGIKGKCELPKRNLIIQQRRKNREFKELLRYNKEIEFIINKKKGVISYYNCIKCQNEFVSPVELNKPTCPMCRGFFK